jgi:cytochrome d ubiquinol oxidase subunit II
VDLPGLWFCLIAALWLGYFVLEGFDFGVGMLAGALSEDDTDRRVVVNTIGPVWDGNEVWLVVAGGATFAAFPEWYATLFSGFYLPLLCILVALIVRGLAFEYRGKGDTDRWRRGWDRALFWGSAVPALLWGVAFANLVDGVPLDADHEFSGGVLDLLGPYALLGGVTTLTLFALHGAVFVALKTDGAVRLRARRLSLLLTVPAVLAAGPFLVWTQVASGNAWSAAAASTAVVGLLSAVGFIRASHEGRAFAATAVTIGAAVAMLFLALWPDVMPADIAANSLTVQNAASTDYTLKVMSFVALAGLPVVLVYQGWTYWVFRQRLTRSHIAPSPLPPDAVPPQRSGRTAARR